MTKRKTYRRVAVIMAGGSGERFWPLSRSKRPKQMLRLASETESLLEQAIGRISPHFPIEDIYIATSRELAPSIRAGGLNCLPENVLAEPCKRNTAGCLIWVAAELSARHPDCNLSLAVLTSDHSISAAPRFRARIKEAMGAAEKNGALVTIGIKPTRPETGYGYIEVQNPGEKGNVRRVDRFREKPNRELAEEFVSDGRHYWNSGMFFWTVDTFHSELKAASPASGEKALSIADHLIGGRRKAAEKEFAALENISIDFALMEKTTNVLMVEANFPWDDVGTWDALDRSRPHDANGNVAEGDPVLVDTKSCIVVNEPGAAKVAVAVVGAENLVVIVSKDGILVTTKAAVQDVRLAPRELRKRGAKQI